MAQAAHARELGPIPGGIRSFLPYSVAATLSVLALPSSILFSLLLLTEPNPPVLLCSAISIALSSLASMIGARLWQKHPRSDEISFGDLMIWSWWTRRRAERRLSRGTAALGLDRRGTPVGEQHLSREDQLRVLHELNEALESKDPYTRGHSRRVERHVFRMANTMGLSVHDIEDLRLAASLHDVGKIRVPDHILRKPGALTPTEYRIMQDHPSVGAWMLSYVGNQDVIEAVRYHHERWDGRGYPDGLSGTDIPLFARMIAVADTFDAITSTRPYRAKSARNEGLKELKKCAGSQLDPMCVESFASSLPDPVPVAAVLFLLPLGIKKLIRELGVSARRAGMQTIATGVGAASAAVIVTTPVVAPALGAPPRVERSVDVTNDDSAPPPLADDGETSTQVADDKATQEDGSRKPDNGFEKDEDAGSGTFGRVFEGDDEPLTSIPITANDVPPSETAGEQPSNTGDTGSSDTGTGSTDTGPAGGDEGSSNEGDRGGSDQDNGNEGNGNSGDSPGGNGNPGASAGQQGRDNNDKGNNDNGNNDKGKNKDEPGTEAGEPGDPGDPGGSDDAGNGNPGGGGDHGHGNSDNGNAGDNSNSGGNGNGNSGGSDNGGGPPEDRGNGNEDPGAGNSGSNANGNPGGGNDKDKDKVKPEDSGTTGSE